MLKSRAGSKALLIVLVLVLLVFGANRYRASASQQLMDAAKAGDTAEVSALIHRFANPNYKDPDGASPLAEAFRANHLDTADALIKAGADPNARLLKTGDDTPLTVALYKGNYPLARDLLAHGAAVNPPHASPLSAVLAHMGPGSGDSPEVDQLEQELLQRGATVNPQGRLTPPIIAATATGRTDLVEDLLKRGANVNTVGLNTDGLQGVSPLSIAANAGDARMWSFLLQHGAKVDPNSGAWAAIWAKYCQDPAWIGRLRAAHANLNSEGSSGTSGQTALMLVSKDPAKVSALLALGADPRGRSSDGDTALVFASREASIDVVKLLLAHGASVNEVGLNNETPLLRAARSQRTDLVRLFLEAGANPNVYDVRGNTPLMYAAIYDTPEPAVLLLDHGAKPDSVDTAHGRTALMLAAETSHLKMMTLLLQRHARVDVKDQDGQTALAYAARRPDPEPTRLLLAAGAKPDIPDNHGTTPVQLAQRLKHDKVVALLTKGATTN